jgi:hypothetical protein
VLNEDDVEAKTQMVDLLSMEANEDKIEEK